MWLPSPRWAKALEWVTQEGSSAGLSLLTQPRPNGSTCYPLFLLFFFCFEGIQGERRGEPLCALVSPFVHTGPLQASHRESEGVVFK